MHPLSPSPTNLPAPYVRQESVYKNRMVIPPSKMEILNKMVIPTFKDGNTHDLWVFFNPYYSYSYPSQYHRWSELTDPCVPTNLRVKCGGFTRQTITTLDELVNVNTIRTITWVRLDGADGLDGVLALDM